MKVELLCKNKLWLAPLAGFTDLPYRLIAKKKRADILTTEMVSAAGLAYNPSASLPYACTTNDPSPIGIQLFGSEPEHFRKAINILPAMDFLCINMGCPVKKVVKTGAGSALMNTPKLAAEIVKECRKALSEKIPLIVKFRSGYSTINYLEFGQKMQEAGANALILHPRTRAEMFSGHSHWSQIKKLKENCQVPVIGNGDIFCKEDIKKMKKETDCDSVMIGRGAIGNPWIFSLQTPTPAEKLETIKDHYNLAIQHYGQTKGILMMRAHIAKYTKNLHDGSKARQIINTLTELKEIFLVLENLFR